MKAIPLYHKGKQTEFYALVDDEDFSKVNQISWFLFTKKNGDKYAYSGSKKRTGAKSRTFHMQNFIMEPSQGWVVDHINGNGLDNRRTNLRVCTRSDNRINTKRLRSFFGDDIDRLKIELERIRIERGNPKPQ